MEHYAGIDVSLESSSIGVVDATGRVAREARLPSEPDALSAWFKGLGLEIVRIGLEAGPLSQWLYAATKQGLPVAVAGDPACAQLIPRGNVRIVITDDDGTHLAQAAATRLRELGYTDVRVLAGGLQSWQAEGKELITATVGNCLKRLARPERLELPTPRFVVWCSIQLSYGRSRRRGVAEPPHPINP